MKFLFRLFLLVIFTCSGYCAFAQLTVSSGITPQQLVQNLLGPGITASNITYIGAPIASGTFNGAASNIGLSSGVLLTSGSVHIAPGPNVAAGDGVSNSLSGYPILDSLSGVQTFDATILEFDFTPLADTIRFRYVFASEEYNEYVCGTVNDVFGFFISGPGIAGERNLALIPGTTTPVSINTLNNGSCGNFAFHAGCDTSHWNYFIDNPGGSTVEYDGWTTVLTAQTVIIPCLSYHIRLAIADGGDWVFDSGVFLEAGSFISGSPILAVAQATNGTLGCAPFTATFTNTSTGTNNFFWDFGDGTPIDTTDSPAHTFMQGGTYNVSLVADDTTACNFSDTTYFTILIDSGNLIPSFNILQTGFCDSMRVDLVSTSRGAHTYAWDFGDGTADTGFVASHVYTTTGTYQLYHIVTNTVCNLRDSVAMPIVLLPKLQSTISTNSVEGCSPLNTTMCYPGSVTSVSQFQWDFGNGSYSTLLCDSVRYQDAGTYHARLIVTDTTFCNRKDTSFVTVYVRVTPEAAFNLPDSQNVLDPVTFENLSLNALTYYWEFDDGEHSYQETPQHQFVNPGIYNIFMTSYHNACYDTVWHRLKVYENPQAIWFPLAFTPNGDGKNDFFSADGIGIVSFQMIIYNRWGEKMFESNGMKNGWDGNFKGAPAENGVYVFHVKATLLNKEEVEKYGTVTVLK